MLCLSLFSLSHDEFATNYSKKFMKMVITALEKPNEFKDIKPHMVYLKLINEIFNILHANVGKEEVPKALELYIQENSGKLMREFEVLGEKLKNKMLKCSCVEDFGF